jgi:hypothetical protein
MPGLLSIGIYPSDSPDKKSGYGSEPCCDTGSHAASQGGVTPHDDGRDPDASGHGAECKPSRSVASNCQGVAASLTDSIRQESSVSALATSKGHNGHQRHESGDATNRTHVRKGLLTGWRD